jgi:hypothetical protein
VGEVIVLAEVMRARRRAHARATCRRILADSVAAARAGLASAPERERHVLLARLRKLEELDAYAAALG